MTFLDHNSKILLRIFILMILLSFPFLLVAQKERTCGVELDKAYQKNHTFENWMQQRLFEKRNKAFLVQRTKNNVITLPIVVHVIHNGEAIGVGSNISEEQILSQIEVLNEDFRRLNADTTLTRDEFKPVAADSEIEFVLAKQDPNGQETNGIVREQGAQTSWSQSDDFELKTTSLWPTADYINIWVTTLSGNLLGYASFPDPGDTGLPGLEPTGGIDGIVIGHPYFGSIAKDSDASLEAPFNLGRTTTHEMGHYLGLRHVWGDNLVCEEDDFCPDTPEERTPTRGSYQINLEKATCESLDMIENYLDYTDDAGMSVFTEDQKERMRIILDGSPDRVTLKDSPGLNDPSNEGLDAGIVEVVEPKSEWCLDSFNPSVWVKNTGTDTIMNFDITYSVGGLQIEETSRSQTLLQNDSILVSFSPLARENTGEYMFEFELVAVNDTIDTNPDNDQTTIITEVLPFQSLPFFSDLDTLPENWEVINSGTEIEFDFVSVPNLELDNGAMMLPFYQNSSDSGVEKIRSPNIDLSTLSNPVLYFDLSYALRTGFEQDELVIRYSSDCGQTYSNLSIISLAENNTSNSELSFYPSSRKNWKRSYIDLSELKQYSSVRIEITGTNGEGNNVFIDNLGITDTIIEELIVSSFSPETVVCGESIAPNITIENIGTKNITSYQLQYNTTAGESGVIISDNLDLKPGEVQLVPMPEIRMISDQINTVTVSFTEINNREYEWDSIFEIIESCSSQESPVRLNFDNSLQWFVQSSIENSWTLASTNFDQSLYVPCYNASINGIRHRVYTEIIDLRNVREASVFFDVSYGRNPNTLNSEQIRVYAYPESLLELGSPLYEKDALELSSDISPQEWVPVSESDWEIREFVNLSELAGSQIRLLFELTCLSGNNFYLDNIEFYNDNDPNPVVPENNYVPYPNPGTNKQFNLAFNLAVKQDVQVTIVDAMGRNVYSTTFVNTLNQTYPFDLAGKGTGLFHVVIKGQTFQDVVKVVLTP